MRDFDKMLKALDLDYKKLSVILGMKYTSVTNQCAPAKELPKWAKTMLWVYENQIKSRI